MSVDNKSFVTRAKEILSEQKVKVTTSQLYEMFSKLSGEKNWNIASQKEINFQDKLAPQEAKQTLTHTYYQIVRKNTALAIRIQEFDEAEWSQGLVIETAVDVARPGIVFIETREDAEKYLDNKIKRLEIWIGKYELLMSEKEKNTYRFDYDLKKKDLDMHRDSMVVEVNVAVTIKP